MGTWRFLGRGVVVAGMVSLLAVLGCSEQVGSDESAASDLPENLALVQGTWSCGCTSTNGLSCQVVIDGYTIRLRYQENAEAPVVRESAGIERIDEELKALVLSGNNGAWPYLRGENEDGMEYLELEFYNRAHARWEKLKLQRIEDEHS